MSTDYINIITTDFNLFYFNIQSFWILVNIQ